MNKESANTFIAACFALVFLSAAFFYPAWSLKKRVFDLELAAAGAPIKAERFESRIAELENTLRRLKEDLQETRITAAVAKSQTDLIIRRRLPSSE